MFFKHLRPHIQHMGDEEAYAFVGRVGPCICMEWLIFLFTTKLARFRKGSDRLTALAYVVDIEQDCTDRVMRQWEAKNSGKREGPSGRRWPHAQELYRSESEQPFPNCILHKKDLCRQRVRLRLCVDRCHQCLSNQSLERSFFSILKIEFRFVGKKGLVSSAQRPYGDTSGSDLMQTSV